MIRGTASADGWTLRHDALLKVAVARYRAALPTLAPGHGRCFEFAAIAAEVAEEIGLPAKARVGTWRGPAGPVAHAWVEVAPFILHAPRRVEVEVVPLGSAAFEAARSPVLSR